MSITYKVDGVDISAIRDRAMFNTFAGNQSYVIKGVGDELKVTSSANSFTVTLGTGEAVICGGSTLIDASETLTLSANQSGYLVLEVDLTQSGVNVCKFINVASLVQNNINDGVNTKYDLPLYQYRTNANGVSSATDVRNILNDATSRKMNLVSSATNNHILLTNVGGQAIDSGRTLSEYATVSQLNTKQNALTAGLGIQIVDNTITNAFSSITGVDLNTIKYNFVGFIFNATANYPSGFNASGELIVIANYRPTYADNHCMQIWSPYNVNDTLVRKFNVNTSAWSAWTQVSLEAKGTLTNNITIHCAGIIANSRKDLRFTLPIPSIKKSSSVTINSMNVTVRGWVNVDGVNYAKNIAVLYNGALQVNNDLYPLTVNIIDGVGLNIVSSRVDSVWNDLAVDNAPCDVQVNSYKITVS